MSRLVLMGSGETAPSMVRTHRSVLPTGGTRAAGAQGPAVLLDTPFGFQTNADDLVASTTRYFEESVGLTVQVARWRRADAPLLERERALALIDRARWAFAGPGSPTYALRQWEGTPVPQALAGVAERGGTLVLGSAAACTGGAFAVPVYEIYKVGLDPQWLPGLDLIGRVAGLRAAVVPHYDNAEGGKHDTRYCYLGEQRLAVLEEQLSGDVGVLGIDEHTALVVDVAAGTARVTGTGGVTVRRRGVSVTVRSGEELDLEHLQGMLRGEADAAARSAPAPTGTLPTPRPGGAPDGDPGDHPDGQPDGQPSLRRDAAAARARFDTALATPDVDGCVAAVLDLEAAIEAWATDTDQNDDADGARRTLRAMVVELGELARVGARDPRDVLGPFVELLLDVRGRARAVKDFATSDLVRDGLAGAGIEVRDTPQGPAWSRATPGR